MDVLSNFSKTKKKLDKYELHQFSVLNERFFETDHVDKLDKTIVCQNLKAYHDYLLKHSREAYAHFVSMMDGSGYKQMLRLINKELPETYKQIIEFIQTL